MDSKIESSPVQEVLGILDAVLMGGAGHEVEKHYQTGP
jgi:hypothetical protein